MENMKKCILIICLLITYIRVNAQINQDELIIFYGEEANQEAIHHYFGISSLQIDEMANPDMERWYDLALSLNTASPASIDAGYPEGFPDIAALRGRIDDIIDGETADDGNINEDDFIDVDYNYILELFDDVPIDDFEDQSPLPNCGITKDEFLFKTFDGNIDVDDIDVYILDQAIVREDPNKPAKYDELIPAFESAGFEPYPQDISLGGEHGQLVLNLIKNQLSHASITGVKFYSVNLFNADGVATYDRLLDFLDAFIKFRDYQHGDGIFRKVVINLSASFLADQADEEDVIVFDLWDQLSEENNVLMVSSAGNHALAGSNLIYPGCGNYENELTLTGTQNCLQSKWEHSNTNQTHFELASEAEAILSHANNQYQIVNGTSFATAFGTGGILQVAAQCRDFSLVQVSKALQRSAKVNEELVAVCKEGRVLHVTNTINKLDQFVICSDPYPTNDGTGGNPGSGDGRVEMDISPNPFVGRSVATFMVEEGDIIEVFLVKTTTQLVVAQNTWRAETGGEVQWQLPSNLYPGTYLLRVRIGEEWQQQLVVKQ